ncbi:MAG: phosphoglycerate kinase [bacterium]
MNKIEDITDLADKKVLVRVDYNVPVKKGKVTNNERVIASLETINFLIEKGAGVVLCSHLGRPDGQKKIEFSLKPLAKELESLIKTRVKFVDDCIGLDKDKAVMGLKPGEVLLLENVRFYPEEETNDALFAQKLSRGCDIYIDDAFSSSHRAHASVVGVSEYLPSYAGFCMEKEIDNLSKLLGNTAKPFVFISGGAKISDKIGILENLLGKVDTMLIGGGMANTFLSGQQVEVGCSLYEEDFVKKSQEIITLGQQKGIKIILPIDVVITRDITENAKGLNVPIDEVGELDIIADIGFDTISLFEKEIAKAGTVFWNGPLGVAEFPEFAKGTVLIGKAIARNESVFSVIGGGDTIAAISEEVKDNYSFVSMAGGASMEFLEGKELPGIKALEYKVV